jgi:CspA family cold shock protein
MYSGTVKFFNESKGFGFVVDSSSNEEIFVHVTGLIDNIREGDKVTFNTERGKKGMNAVDVKVAE